MLCTSHLILLHNNYYLLQFYNTIIIHLFNISVSYL